MKLDTEPSVDGGGAVGCISTSRCRRSTAGAGFATGRQPTGSAAICGMCRMKYVPGSGNSREHPATRQLMAGPVLRPDGRQRGKSFKRKSDAERWLAEAAAHLSFRVTGPTLRAAGSPSVSTPSAWLGSRTDRKPKTRHQYELLMGLHILPTWRTVPLAKITFEGLSEWVAQLPAGEPRPLRGTAVGVRNVGCTRSRGTQRAHPCQPGPRPGPAASPAARLHRPDSRAAPRAVRGGRALAGPGLLLGLHGPALGRGHRTARLRNRPGPPQDRRPPGVLRCRRAASSWAPRNRTSPAASPSRGSWPARSRWPSRASDLMTWCSPCPAARCCGCPTGAVPFPARPRSGRISTDSAFTSADRAASLMIQADIPRCSGDPGQCQHHHDAGPVRAPYPGEMDSYADLAEGAAEEAETRLRPDEDDDASGESA